MALQEFQKGSLGVGSLVKQMGLPRKAFKRSWKPLFENKVRYFRIDTFTQVQEKISAPRYYDFWKVGIPFDFFVEIFLCPLCTFQDLAWNFIKKIF